MNYKKINLVILLSLLCLIFSCEETIDWEVEQSDARLVVEARITTELIRHQVKLTQTADYFSTEQPAGVEDAVVTINDGERDIMLAEMGNGIYQMSDAVAGEVGKTYTLNIKLATPIGEETDFSASSTIEKVLDIDEINIYEEIVENFGENFTEYYLNFSGQEIENQEDYFFAEVFVNSELENDGINDFIYFNDDLVDGSYFEELDIWSTEDELATGDEITLKLYSTEEGYETFIEALQQEADRSDILGLSGPPANVKGNISNKAIGYFYAADVSEMTTIVEE